MTKPDDDAAKWEELARREPYFALLSDVDAGVKGSKIASDAFFKTGEDDIAALLAAMTDLLSHAVRLDSVLDFGCGAGRLTLPLARRAGHVEACDLAPTMLSHARQNAERAGIHNITFKLCDDVTRSAGTSFDFICSLLVFQYIAPARGYARIQSLATLLRRDGIAALQLTLHEPTSRIHQLGSPAPFARLHEYDEHLVVRAVEAVGASVVARLPTGASNAVLIIRKD